MSKRQKGSALAFGVALVFITLEIILHVQTASAGVFIAGMAGGLLIGDQMARVPAGPT